MTAHGYMRSPDGTIVTFDPPGSVNTFVTGLNINNLTVGYYYDASGGIHGFLRRDNGNISSFDIPGAVITIAVSDNTADDVAGTFFLAIRAERERQRANSESSSINYPLHPVLYRV